MIFDENKHKFVQGRDPGTFYMTWTILLYQNQDPFNIVQS